MAFPERILGYGARTLDPALEGLWDTRRRETFLLRPDVRVPLSVDVLVWPSVFTPLASPRDLITAAQGFQAIERDLASFKKQLRDRTPASPYSVVAITLPDIDQGSSSELDSLRQYVAVTSPAVVDVGMVKLGYDVADASLMSALMNCAPPPDKVLAQRREWVPSIKDYHLFADVDAAGRFRDAADRRVPDHAPFFVFGMYRLPTTGLINPSTG